MRKFALLASAAILVPAASSAAPILTGVSVEGLTAVGGATTGTVWNTQQDSFYTVFLQSPGLGNFLNPTDNFTNQTIAATTRYLLAGDGFPDANTANSDLFYRISLNFADGHTLVGTYSSALNSFLGGNSFTADGSTYSISEFSWQRYLGDAVNQFVATPGGNGNDYAGNVRLAVAAVPETATWAMMIAGFGLVGGAMRRRSAARVSFG